MTNRLEPIVAATRRANETLDRERLRRDAEEAAGRRPRPHRFREVMRFGIDPSMPVKEPAPLSDRGFALRLIAEIKAASPSAGTIVEHVDAAAIARDYTRAGASAISVVVEPEFFRGSHHWIRQASMASGLPILMKDFVVDAVQIDRGVVAGADAILLLASLLDASRLREFVQRCERLGVDCVVEVHDEEELSKAVEAGPHIIGVNNRDLRDFSVDLATAERLAKNIPGHVVRIAESGIKSTADVARLISAGYDAMLVGESLLRQRDRAGAARALARVRQPRLKFCGITREQDARAAATAGATHLGFIFAADSPRYIDPRRAQEIAEHLRAELGPRAPRIVGVFRNAEAEEIGSVAATAGLDLIQLHGEEAPEILRYLERPVIKALPVETSLPAHSQWAAAEFLMFDTRSNGRHGGTGRSFDWHLLDGVEERFFLAGGLTAENVAEAIRIASPYAVDVSSGVEESPGVKNAAKIQAFADAVERGWKR